MENSQLSDHRSFVNQTLMDWNALLRNIFPTTIPEHAEWTSADQIVETINQLGRIAPHNHMFLPNGGGLDIHGARLGHEPNTIELNTGFTLIIRPTSLSFENLDSQTNSTSYFRLETSGLTSSGIYKSRGQIYEEVTELEPGHFVDRDVWETGYYGHNNDGEELPLPLNARCITRYFSGAFVIVPKGSFYNLNSSTYDGRHNKMNAQEFLLYMRRVLTSIQAKVDTGDDSSGK